MPISSSWAITRRPFSGPSQIEARVGEWKITSRVNCGFLFGVSTTALFERKPEESSDESDWKDADSRRKKRSVVRMSMRDTTFISPLNGIFRRAAGGLSDI